MQYTIFEVPVLRNLLQGLSILILKIFGWRRVGQLPDFPKYVIIVAPHTSNWDLFVGLALAFAFKLKAYWLGKDVLFRWPIRGFFKWLGGIPIDRSKSVDVVAQMVEVFREKAKMVIALAPEGTRKKVSYWKTGFYHIAWGANVPIVFAFLDYLRKAGGIGFTFKPTGDIQADMEVIRAFYARVTGKYPEEAGLVAVMPGKLNE